MSESGDLLQKRIFGVLKRYAGLAPGRKTGLKKARLEEISSLEPFFEIAPISLDNGVKVYKDKEKWSRVVYLLRYFPKHDKTAGIGRLLAECEVAKERMEVIRRALYPENMRYMAGAAEILVGKGREAVDWTTFGPCVYYWDNKTIRDMVASYYAAVHSAARDADDEEE